MMIITVTSRAYGMMFPCPPHIFNGVAFTEHNHRHKCDDGDVRYLFAGDGKVRGGTILRASRRHAPLSVLCPFGGLTVSRSRRFEAVDGMWREIVGIAGRRDWGCA